MTILNQSKKLVSKIIPLIAALLILLAGITWIIQTTNKKIEIPFSSVEETIQEQNGKQVVLTEHSDGSILLEIDGLKYESHVPPNSQMIDKLVENYNIQYSFSNSSRFGKWIMAGVLLTLVGTAFVLQRTKGGFGLSNSMKNSVSQARPLPSISLDDVGGIGEEMKEEILQTLSTLKEPERAVKMGIRPQKVFYYMDRQAQEKHY